MINLLREVFPQEIPDFFGIVNEGVRQPSMQCMGCLRFSRAKSPVYPDYHWINPHRNQCVFLLPSFLGKNGKHGAEKVIERIFKTQTRRASDGTGKESEQCEENTVKSCSDEGNV